MTFDWRFGVLTVAWMGAIYWLSSRPDPSTTGSTTGSDSVVRGASNLAHIPLFAGLAFCWLHTLSARHDVSWWRYGLTFLGAGTYAALDEWHQSFVPGRQASVGDFLVDLASIGGMLLILRVQMLRGSPSQRSSRGFGT
jgi:VanZ family protein